MLRGCDIGSAHLVLLDVMKLLDVKDPSLTSTFKDSYCILIITLHILNRLRTSYNVHILFEFCHSIKIFLNRTRKFAQNLNWIRSKKSFWKIKYSHCNDTDTVCVSLWCQVNLFATRWVGPFAIQLFDKLFGWSHLHFVCDICLRRWHVFSSA